MSQIKLIGKIFTAMLFSIALLASCQTQEQKVSREEAQQVADKIEGSVAAGRPDFINDFIDQKIFIKKISKVLKEDKPSLNEGISEGLQRTKLGDQIVAAVNNKGNYRLVKIFEKDGRQQLLFRMYADHRLNYHDFELVKTGKDVKAADIYIYLSGDWLSNTMAGTIGMLKEGDLSSANAVSVQDVRSKMSAGNYTEAKRVFDALPIVIKNSKAFQMMNILICSNLEDDDYSKAMDGYKSLYPNEPNMNLMMIDYYILRKDYPRAMESVNKMDAYIDRDPFLDYYRALIYLLMEDRPKAVEKLEKLLTAMPGFTEGTQVLLINYLHEKDYDKAVAVAKRYKADKNYSEEYVNDLEQKYPDFAAKMRTE